MIKVFFVLLGLVLISPVFVAIADVMWWFFTSSTASGLDWNGDKNARGFIAIGLATLGGICFAVMGVLE